MRLKIGDTVQLKSGGPVMTVAGSAGPNEATCIWYAAAQGEFRTRDFPEALLDEVELEDGDD